MPTITKVQEVNACSLPVGLCSKVSSHIIVDFSSVSKGPLMCSCLIA